MFDDLFDDLPTSDGMSCIRRDSDQPVATVMDSERSSRAYLAFMRGEIEEATLDEQLDACIVERGMTKAQIEAAFPPDPAVPGKSRALI